MSRVFGLDAGSSSLREADHLIQDQRDLLGLPDRTIACTHFVRAGRPHVAMSFQLPPGFSPEAWWERLAELAALGIGVSWESHQLGPVELSGGATEAAAELAGKRSGRAVVYPGVDRLVGEITVGSLLDDSAIDRVVVLAGEGEPAPEAVVYTRDHVRPEWREGQLTLITAPASNGAYVPFEVPDPTPCCADHG
ncbi:MAG: hypothetical protein QOI21_3785 [Actinomycetota bacterium]|jgi:hypothetical protein|nr:hypothetical protein [Actinomycetota bacterium]